MRLLTFNQIFNNSRTAALGAVSFPASLLVAKPAFFGVVTFVPFLIWARYVILAPAFAIRAPDLDYHSSPNPVEPTG